MENPTDNAQPGMGHIDAPKVPQGQVPESGAPSQPYTPPTSSSLRKGIYDSIKSPGAGSRFDLGGLVSKIVTYIIWIACTVISVGLVFLVIVPQYERYNELTVTIEERQIELDKLSAFVDYLRNLQSLQEQLFANTGLAKQSIPDEDKTPFFLDQIIQIADESGVVIDTISFGGASSIEEGTYDPVTGELVRRVDELKKFNVKVIFSSSYNRSKGFIEALEKARRIASVATINMRVVDDEDKLSDFVVREISETPQNPDIDDADGVTVTVHPVAESVLYSTEILIEGYFMSDPNVDNLSLESLINQPKLENILVVIEGLKYYEPLPAELTVGRFNPFELRENQSQETLPQVQDEFEDISTDDGFDEIIDDDFGLDQFTF